MDKQMMSMDELEQVNGGKFAGASGHSINLGKLLFGDEPKLHGPEHHHDAEGNIIYLAPAHKHDAAGNVID